MTADENDFRKNVNEEEEEDEEEDQVKELIAKASARGKYRLDARDIPSIDHAHIVCHHHGCEEVKAKLSVIEGRIKTVKGKLAECASSRKQLEADLVAAAKKR